MSGREDCSSSSYGSESPVEHSTSAAIREIDLGTQISSSYAGQHRTVQGHTVETRMSNAGHIVIQCQLSNDAKRNAVMSRD